MFIPLLFRVFFFQAEDGIRDVAVTGVQTCALPILMAVAQIAGSRAIEIAGLVQGSDGNFYGTTSGNLGDGHHGTVFKISATGALTTLYRSEERRVGKGRRTRGWSDK